ncbi:hypothetical protein SNE40_021218 [Patella caerulea]
MKHRTDPQLSLHCPIDGCWKPYASFNAYKSHVYRIHMKSQRKRETSDLSCHITCAVCSMENISNIKLLISHLSSHLLNSVTVICPFDKCSCTYDKASSLRSHICRVHSPLCNKDNSVLKHEYLGISTSAFSDQAINEPTDLTEKGRPTMHTASHEQGDNFENNFIDSFALSILKIQELCYLPVSTVDTILSEINGIHELSFDALQFQIISLLTKQNVDVSVLDQIKECFYQNIFDKSVSYLKSNYLRNKYWKRQLRYVEPVRITLDKNECHKSRSFEYIPLLESLKSILSVHQVLTDVMNPLPKPKSDAMQDFSHGRYFKENALFSKSEIALQIILYFDEFEVVNTLGSKRGIHKIAAVYYTLGNIYPWHRSELKTIQLCVLCPNTILKNVGFDEVLKPLIYDLHILETVGIEILNVEQKLFGTVAFVAADNLGSHRIGGFVESFSSNVENICRFCLGTSNQIQTQYNSDQFEFRNEVNYSNHVKKAAQDTGGRAHYLGVKHDSVLNNLNYYHITRGLPPDCMHDVLQGVCRYELPLILQKLEKQKHFSRTTSFKIMKTWKYGVNKPPVPKSLNSIPSSASQMWTLVRILPLMIGEYVPIGDETYEILLILKLIVELVFAPEIQIQQIAYLDSLIKEHMEIFTEMFPEQRIIPKQHFLIHYPSHIFNYGPLHSCWCMRFESKHNYFKILSHRLGNFTNICYTLATRHQRLQAFLTTSDDDYFRVDKITSPVNVMTATLRMELQNGLLQKGIFDTNIYQTSKVFVNGVTYQPGMYVVTNLMELNEIEFSKILGIYQQSTMCHTSQDNILPFVESQISSFHHHYGAIEVDNKDKFCLYYVNELTDYYPLDEYIVDGKKFICLKHALALK